MQTEAREVGIVAVGSTACSWACLLCQRRARLGRYPACLVEHQEERDSEPAAIIEPVQMSWAKAFSNRSASSMDG